MTDINTSQMDAIELQRSVIGSNIVNSNLSVSPDEIIKALQRTKDLMNLNESNLDQSLLLTSSPRSVSESQQRSFNTGNDVISLKKEAMRRYTANNEATLNHSRNSSVTSFNLNEDNVSLYQKHLTQKHGTEVNELKEHIERLDIKLNRLKYDLKSRDTTIEDLKVKISEMYVELELSQISKKQNQHELQLYKEENSRLRIENEKFYDESKEDKNNITKQIEQAKENLSKHESMVESLRKENETLKNDNTEIKLKAMKEKEELIKNLEGIEQSIIQREKNSFNKHYEKILIESCKKVQEEEAKKFQQEIKRINILHQNEISTMQSKITEYEISIKDQQEKRKLKDIDDSNEIIKSLIAKKDAEIYDKEILLKSKIKIFEKEIDSLRNDLNTEKNLSAEKIKELNITQKQKFKLMAQLKKLEAQKNNMNIKCKL